MVSLFHSHIHCIESYRRFHLVCRGIKFGERNFFCAWYKLKLICVLYFHFVPSPEKVSLAKFFPETNQVESTILGPSWRCWRCQAAPAHQRLSFATSPNNSGLKNPTPPGAAQAIKKTAKRHKRWELRRSLRAVARLGDLAAKRA